VTGVQFPARETFRFFYFLHTHCDLRCVRALRVERGWGIFFIVTGRGSLRGGRCSWLLSEGIAGWWLVLLLGDQTLPASRVRRYAATARQRRLLWCGWPSMARRTLTLRLCEKQGCLDFHALFGGFSSVWVIGIGISGLRGDCGLNYGGFV
jgi:hypothetical protein